MKQKNSLANEVQNSRNETKSLTNGTISNSSCEYRNSDSWEEVTIEVPWGFVAGKWWGSRDKQPILALHGWQDNCGTFDRLCPIMPAEIPILALDLPGHGKSSRYPKGMQYYIFWDGITLIRRIIRNYNWKNVILMGHSMGGALSFMYAANFPHEVDKLINIDIVGPPIHGLQSVDRTGWSIDKILDYEELSETDIPCYTYKQAQNLILDAYRGSLNLPSADTLMKRGIVQAPKHLHKNRYHFTCDMRINVSFLGMLSKEQVLAYAERIKCKVLNIRADSGNRSEKADSYDDLVAALRKNATIVVYEKVPGTHHLHLVSAERVAPHINKFLLET